MRHALLAAAFLLAPPLAAQENTGSAADRAAAGFDGELGLWFPPGVPKDVYLSGSDPQHPFIQDVQRALQGDEQLRQEVCALLNDPRREPRNPPPRALQLRTMSHMLCIGIPMRRNEEQREAEARRTREAEWRAALDLAGARKLAWEERGERAEALYSGLDFDGDVDPKLDRALTALGLQPQNDAYLWAALVAFPFPGTRLYEHFTSFLEELFVAESAEGAFEPARFRRGLRNLRFLTGDLSAARGLTERLLSDGAGTEYDTVALAVIDRGLGKTERWTALLASCPRSAWYDEHVASEGDSAAAYCWYAARVLAARAVDVQGAKTPAGLRALLLESIAAEPANWPGRLDAIRAIAKVDGKRARAECEALLAVPATLVPAGARMDTLSILASLARTDGDTAVAYAAFDRFLDLLQYHPPAIPKDLWERMRAQPEPEVGAVGLRSTQDQNVFWALSQKASLSISTGAFDQAKRLLEAYFAHALALFAEEEAAAAEVAKAEAAMPELAAALGDLGKDRAARLAYAASSVRHRMVELARALAKAGRRSESLRICGFLTAQPHLPESDKLVTDLSSLRSELQRAAGTAGQELRLEDRPWDAPSRPAGKPRPK